MAGKCVSLEGFPSVVQVCACVTCWLCVVVLLSRFSWLLVCFGDIGRCLLTGVDGHSARGKTEGCYCTCFF